MTLPLDDKTNPLYGLDVQQQCQKLIALRQSLTPWKLFSLDLQYYTAQEADQAFRQLAFRFHPDKNPNMPEIVDAFNIVNDAKAYMLYLVLSDKEKHGEYEKILNNPFYQQYGPYDFYEAP